MFTKFTKQILFTAMFTFALSSSVTAQEKASEVSQKKDSAVVQEKSSVIYEGKKCVKQTRIVDGNSVSDIVDNGVIVKQVSMVKGENNVLLRSVSKLVDGKLVVQTVSKLTPSTDTEETDDGTEVSAYDVVTVDAAGNEVSTGTMTITQIENSMVTEEVEIFTDKTQIVTTITQVKEVDATNIVTVSLSEVVIRKDGKGKVLSKTEQSTVTVNDTKGHVVSNSTLISTDSNGNTSKVEGSYEGDITDKGNVLPPVLPPTSSSISDVVVDTNPTYKNQ